MSCVFNDTIAECRRPYTLGANMCSCVVGYMWSSRSILPCCFGLAKSVWAPSKHGRLQRPRRQMVNPLKLQRMNGDGIEIFRGEATLGWTWRGLSEWWPSTCQQAKRSSARSIGIKASCFNLETLVGVGGSASCGPGGA
jgi:hypothetical protein